MLARFRQEAKALARLQDPAILAIHFTGDGEGLVYYVMPFVEGESLAERLRRRGPYTADEALKIAEPILQALSHAHTQGLVHRDIKPDNVMVEAKSGRVLLLDFGIAKLLDPPGGRRSRRRQDRHRLHGRYRAVHESRTSPRPAEPRRPERLVCLRRHALPDGDRDAPLRRQLERRARRETPDRSGSGGERRKRQRA